MTVPLGVMGLPGAEDADRVRDYLNGTIAAGGLWTALTRASNHDHTGGVNGTPISVASIPDGSITVAKLDPSVLLPYALVDGSKPFTGQVTMNNNTIVRDTLYFGAKPAGAADITLARTGAGALRLDNHLGVGVAPLAWHASRRAVQVGGAGAFYADSAAALTEMGSNTYLHADNTHHAIVGDAGVRVIAYASGFRVDTAPVVAAGAAQTFTPRLTLDQAGNLGLGAAPEAMLSTYPTFRIGRDGGLYAGNNNAQVILAQNGIFNAAGSAVAVFAGAAARVQFNTGSFSVDTAPSVAAGAAQTFTTRAQIAQNGTLTLTPDAAQPGLRVTFAGNRELRVEEGATSPNPRIIAGTGWLELHSGGGIIGPSYDLNQSSGSASNRWSVVYTTAVRAGPSANLFLGAGGTYVCSDGDGSNYLGHPTQRFQSIYLVAAPVVGSSADLKEDITPLDPAACVASVMETDWVNYVYKAPVFVAPEPSADVAYDEHDSNEAKSEKKAKRDAQEDEARKAHAKSVVETAPHRRQKGYVLGSPDHKVGAEFGLPDGKNRSDGADLAVVACALQDALKRIAVLEGAPN